MNYDLTTQGFILDIETVEDLEQAYDSQGLVTVFENGIPTTWYYEDNEQVTKDFVNQTLKVIKFNRLMNRAIDTIKLLNRGCLR